MDDNAARKDARASATIERVHGILETLGFPRDRAVVRWFTAGDDCHSCHLRFTNYPLIFSNGKGATRDLAYASALAEFIERLQCRIDDLFTSAGNVHRMAPFVARTTRTIAETVAVAPGLVRGDLHWLAGDGLAGLRCLPFADVFGGRVIDLPFDALLMVTSSTGMCAGNTPEEALAQGLCEVFERHAVHAVARGEVPGLPTLPIRSLPLRRGAVRRQLAALRSSGADVLVKDASLGGAFPVVGLVVVDRRAGTCHVSFGSDPDFDIALSRCITEAFQGTSHLVRPIRSGEAATYAPDLYNHLEVLFDRLVEDVGEARADRAFSAVNGSAEALRFAVDRVRTAGLGLYVRDCSLLGFPAYYVYVERLSALHARLPIAESPLHRAIEAVRATLFGLARASRDEVDRCALALFGEVTSHDNPLVELHFEVGVLQAPISACIDLRTLLVLMLLEAGRLGDAVTMVEWPPADQASPGRTALLARIFSLLAPYVEARNGLAGFDHLAMQFERAFGSAPAGPEIVAAPGGPLLIPRCSSVYACPSCACRRYCRLDEWYRLARLLRARATEIDQRHLVERLRIS